MRILYHHRTLGDGAEGIHIREIISALRKLGHEVKMVSLVGENEMINPKKREAKSRWKWVKNSVPSFLFEIAEMMYNFKGYRLILKEAKNFKPDFIYDRYISYNYSAIKASKSLGIPCILEVNSPYATQRLKWEKIWFPKLIQYFETKITNGADLVITVSSALKDHLIEQGTSAEKIYVMPNGTDPDKFKERALDTNLQKKYGISPHDIVIGFVGVLRKWHNIEFLLEVFKELTENENNLKLLFVGDGENRVFFQELADSLKISERVIFTGRVPHGEVPNYISLFDIAISPHVTYYSSPMKILEYMSMGKCTVAPNMKNIKDLIIPAETGILFEPKDKKDLTTKLLEVVRNEEFRKKIGARAKETVRNNYTWENNAKVLVELAKDLINKK